MTSATFIPELGPTLIQLIERTAQNRVRWKAKSEGIFTDLPSATIALNRTSDGTISLSLLSPGGEVIWTNSANDEFNSSVLQQLFEAGQTSAVAAVLGGISRDLSSDELDYSTTTTPEPSPPPERPNSERAFEFFERIKGRWHLDYSRGKEDIEIDENGNLFIIASSRGQPAIREPRPRYRLELLECNDDLSQIEVAKVEPTGRIRHIEVLTLEADRMSGFAKRDGHRLDYKRTK